VINSAAVKSREAVAARDALPERGPAWWSVGELAALRDRPRLRRIGVAWALAILASIAAGVANVRLGWNGIELAIAGLPFEVTIYPPFVIAVLLSLWLGPGWGAVPIYLANFASAVASGLPAPVAALFALAGVIETLMLWGSLVALRVDPDLRALRDVVWYLAAGLVAAVAGSLAAIVWNASHGLTPEAGLRIWRGWIVGDLLQLAIVVLPILLLAGPRVRAWCDRQFVPPPRRDFSYTHAVGLLVVTFLALGLVVFFGVQRALESIEAALPGIGDGRLLMPRLREIVLVMALLSVALIVATGMFSTALARLGERQRREALRDSLTGCFNRRAFDRSFEVESERSRRLGLGLGVLFLDLDRFKALNDDHGHAAGDLLLERFARRVEASLRETDLLFRWGGEEFVVLMPHTSASEVGKVAERVRGAVAAAPLAAIAGIPDLGTTVSIGATATVRFPADPRELVHIADEACYEAKRMGRDRVIFAG